MQIFISGTDTNIGKTIIASWLALHTNSAYFKPIQTGAIEGRDSLDAQKLAGVKIYPEIFLYQKPLSPHLAAELEDNQEIEVEKIVLPQEKNLIVEGAGGLLVPINKKTLMIDLIAQLNLPIILVASSKLGTINHTLLSIEAIRSRNLSLLGVIMNGNLNYENKNAIEFYGKSQILAQFPWLDILDHDKLVNIALPEKLKQALT